MMFLKLMSDQNLPDDCLIKNFTLVSIDGAAALRFEDNPNASDDPLGDCHVLAVVSRPGMEDETYPLHGTAYIMNSQGRTIASRNPESYSLELKKNRQQ